MKKTILSLVTISAIATTGVLADSATDIAELKAMMMEMNKRLAKLETENKQLKAQVAKKKKVTHTASKKKTTAHKKHYALTPEKKDRVEALEAKVEKLEKQTPVFAKTSKLKFSGKHYLGFVHGEKTDAAGVSDTYNKFETRRNYLQVKGYFFDDPKSYMRLTLDTAHVDSGEWEVRLKYAYLYLNDVLPYTGVEFGQAHRPWIDYEEHHGWLYRSIAKTFVERGHDADFTNSSDIGINFKTNTEYFSSELGIFNGEGYHGNIDGDGLSYEWRLTANLLGTGKEHVHKSDRYADISFYGQDNTSDPKHGELLADGTRGDFVWYGFNAVYNQPEFLIAANYLKSTTADDKFKGDGWSINGELRLLTFDPTLSKWNLIARYDDWSLDSGTENTSVIAGVAYKWNKNVEFILNYDDYQSEDATGALTEEDERVLFTAEVNW
jgi:regulator of replication initiation timing